MILMLLFLSDFWLDMLNLKNTNNLKKISEKLMPVAWHPNRWWNFCVPEDEGIEIFVNNSKNFVSSSNFFLF